MAVVEGWLTVVVAWLTVVVAVVDVWLTAVVAHRGGGLAGVRVMLLVRTSRTLSV